jgi:hypothetical protein
LKSFSSILWKAKKQGTKYQGKIFEIHSLFFGDNTSRREGGEKRKAEKRK